MDPTDEELLAQARDGNREALSALLERTGPVVRRGVEGRIPKRWQSLLSEDDVMQQTYADAAIGLGQFVYYGEGSFRAWLASLAKYNLLDAIKMLEAEKRGGNRRRIEAASGETSYLALYEHLGATSSTPSRRAALDEAQTALEKALQQLPPAYRMVVRMYDLDGRPIEAVAAALGRSKGAVYMLRSRALERVAEIMGTASKYLSRGA